MKKAVVALALALGLSAALGHGQTPAEPAGPQDPARAGRGGRQGAPGRGRAGTAVQPGDECPPGTTLVRPNNCGRPELPAPSIVDYRPARRSSRPSTKCRGRNFPSSTTTATRSAAEHARGTRHARSASLDSLNVRLMMVADNMPGDRLKRAADAINASPLRRTACACWRGIELAERRTRLGGEGGRATRGGRGGGRGRRRRDREGLRPVDHAKPTARDSRIDDPELEPIWDACARLKLPVFIHTADPQEFFQPIDYTNERWLELSLFGDRRYRPISSRASRS